MRIIQLTQGKSALVDDEDYELISKYKWHAHSNGKNWYATTWIDGKLKRMHRLIMEQMLGRLLLPNEHIDHIDSNGLNNQRGNLRVASQSQNAMNRQKIQNASSKYKGVSWDRSVKRWLTRITYNGKEIILGYFSDEVEAAKTHDVAARVYFGDYAKLNFEEEGKTSAIGIPWSKQLTKKVKYEEPAKAPTDEETESFTDVLKIPEGVPEEWTFLLKKRHTHAEET